jgi:superfamily II DNA or RNA helicase
MPAKPIADRTISTVAPSAVRQSLPPSLAAGAMVVVRGRCRRLHATVDHADCCELRLDGDGPARSRTLLWPFDRPSLARTGPLPLRVVRPRAWTVHLRRLQALELDVLTPRVAAGDVNVVPFQVAPCLTMARGNPRVLLADEVGLGKTIQCGWIVADVVARNPPGRVLIAVPAAVKHQWIGELSHRFKLAVEDVDARRLRSRIADLPAEVSPWAPPGIYISSIDFLKRPDVAASACNEPWDLLVVDEAHTAAAPTERHAALSAIARSALRTVLITATPYSGDNVAFLSMAAIGSTNETAPILFRRFRQDVGDARVRRHRIVTIRLSGVESRFQRLLERYTENVWHDASDTTGARLAMTILRKRALSSPAAAARSLRRRLSLLSATPKGPQQPGLFDDGEFVDDEVDDAALAVPGLRNAVAEERWLNVLIDAADRASPVDSKLRFLQRLLRRLGNEPVVIFTEYRDTLQVLAAALPGAMQLHGGMSRAERVAVQTTFNHEGGRLLATDAAAEGLNLQDRCRVAVNFELPWNPARLEQRIGRIDRIGQRRSVHAITMTARDTAEHVVIAALVRRLTRIVRTLGTRDRLGALLDEATIAQLVIGHGTLNTSAADDSAVEAVTFAPLDIGDDERRATTQVQSSVQHMRQHVPVAHMRAGSAMQPGAVVVMLCTARTAEGFVVARKTVALHLDGRPPRPRSAAETRAVASTFLRRVDLPLTPILEDWLQGVRVIHEDTVDRILDRLHALRAAASESQLPMQPGLFDRRALAAMAEARDAQDRLAADYNDRIAALERSKAIEMKCEPAALLIGWP